jgi:hypothetical protein
MKTPFKINPKGKLVDKDFNDLFSGWISHTNGVYNSMWMSNIITSPTIFTYDPIVVTVEVDVCIK